MRLTLSREGEVLLNYMKKKGLFYKMFYSGQYLSGIPSSILAETYLEVSIKQIGRFI